MIMTNRTLRTILCVFMALQIWGISGLTEKTAFSSGIVELQQRDMRLYAQQAPLREALDKTQSKSIIRITGLECRGNELITLTCQGQTI